MIRIHTTTILGLLLASSAGACGGAPGAAGPGGEPARQVAIGGDVPPQAPDPPPAASTVEAGAKPPPSAEPQAVPQAPPAPAGSQEIAEAAGDPALEAGAAAVKQGDFGRARKELTQALKKAEGSASLDAVMAAHALLGRSCDRLGDRKCAEKEYAAVVSLWQDRGGSGTKLDALGADPASQRPKVARALLAAGEALYFFAEQKRNEADKLSMPAYTGSGKREDVIKHISTKVGAWIKQKNALIDEAERAYLKILQLNPAPPPRWVIDAAARVGGMWDRFATAFRETPMPKEWNQKGPVPGSPGLTYEEIKSEYLAQINLASEPMLLKARAAFRKCQDFSTKFQYTDELSRSCEDWLKKHPS